ATSSFAHSPQKICAPALGLYSRLKKNEVKVVSLRPEGKINYFRTDRDLIELAEYYPPSLLKIHELQGLKILDAGAGHGQFVREMRAIGVDAVGLDLVLNRELKALKDDIYFEADMAYTPFPQQTFDGIFSTASVLSYEWANLAALDRVVEEFRRILKPGGFVRVAPILLFEAAPKTRRDRIYIQKNTYPYKTETSVDSIQIKKIYILGKLTHRSRYYTPQIERRIRVSGRAIIDLFLQRGFDVEVLPTAKNPFTELGVIVARKK
ncbi:MAG TPA: class I SAM-dependent methyltransferase, partial [Pseudobdellovibrionaceae bacterium]|nr:class I SAM-dependent methyltransferase [Pseudobdellovibrionaceae bacterium]